MKIKRTSKTITIEVKKYFINGIHTCANNFETGNICIFLGERRFGTIMMCDTLKKEIFYKSGMGLIPDKDCILKE